MNVSLCQDKKMNKQELLAKCKELGIKGVSTKNKKEILDMLNLLQKEPNRRQGNPLLEELLSKTPKDKSRKVCKQCHVLGHGVTSTICAVNIDKQNKLKYKIKRYILSQNCLSENTIEDYCNTLSVMLEITPNMCKTLYHDIPIVEWLDRDMYIPDYIDHLNALTKPCNECQKPLLGVHVNTHRIWRGQEMCDTCWFTYAEERDATWTLVKQYRPMICVICNAIQKNIGERFHYDHVNMFDKKDSICTMVNEGIPIEDIYAEIDKCQILCLSCHHIVTDIENKLGFTRIKQHLTRSLNQGDLTEEEYATQSNQYQSMYEKKMKDIYDSLKKSIHVLSVIK